MSEEKKWCFKDKYFDSFEEFETYVTNWHTFERNENDFLRIMKELSTTILLNIKIRKTKYNGYKLNKLYEELLLKALMTLWNYE